MLPTFIVIGAMKSGTTSLYLYLRSHPEIFMSDPKELEFFSTHYDKGIAWYASHFQAKAKAYGEASTGYTKYPTASFSGVPQRMHAVLPDIKLMYIVRDPIERIISQYIHKYSLGQEQRSLDEALATLEGNHYVACSRYYMQLEQYLPYYPKENILVITAEELKHQRQATIRAVYRFVGVDETYVGPHLDVVAHKSSEKRRPRKIRRYFPSKEATNKVKQLLPSPVARWIRDSTLHPPLQVRPTCSPELEARLIDHFRDDVAALRAFTGNNFDGWRAY